MKALILNGAKSLDTDTDRFQAVLADELRGRHWNVEAVCLRETAVTRCVGCFDCWIKTPGICRFKDAGPWIAQSFIQSDLAVFVTPVTFGGYSSELKKALDRAICLISPHFMKIKGEVHHKPRYSRYPRLLAFGLREQPREDSDAVFAQLVGRNALNLHTPAHHAALVQSSLDQNAFKQLIHSSLQALETAP